MNKCECGRLVSGHSIECMESKGSKDCPICKYIIEIVYLESALCDLLKYPNNKTIIDNAMRQVEPRHRNRIEAFHEKAKEEKL